MAHSRYARACTAQQSLWVRSSGSAAHSAMFLGPSFSHGAPATREAVAKRMASRDISCPVRTFDCDDQFWNVLEFIARRPRRSTWHHGAHLGNSAYLGRWGASFLLDPVGIADDLHGGSARALAPPPSPHSLARRVARASGVDGGVSEGDPAA
eukprot:5095165-Prymnesium_polylepis.1